MSEAQPCRRGRTVSAAGRVLWPAAWAMNPSRIGSMTMSRKAPVDDSETREDAEVSGRPEARNGHAQKTARENPRRDQNAVADAANRGLDGVGPRPAQRRVRPESG